MGRKMETPHASLRHWGEGETPEALGGMLRAARRAGGRGGWLLIRAGRGRVRQGERVERVEAGVLLWIDAGPERLEWRVREAPVRWQWCVTAGGLVAGLADALQREGGGAVALPVGGAAMAAFGRLDRFATGGEAAEVGLALYDAFSRALEEAMARREKRAGAGMAALAEAAGGTARIKDLALASGYSETHLRKLLAARWGKAPARRLREERLRRAGERLRAEGGSVMEAATAAGYTSTGAFVAAFARMFGETPGVWRDRRFVPAAGGVAERVEAEPSGESDGMSVRAFAPTASPARGRHRDGVHCKEWRGPWLRPINCGEWRSGGTQPLWFEMTESTTSIIVTRRGHARLRLGPAAWRVQRGTVMFYDEPIRADWEVDARVEWWRFGLRLVGVPGAVWTAYLRERYGAAVQVGVRPVRRAFAALLRATRRQEFWTPGEWSRQVYGWLVVLERALAAGRRVHADAGWLQGILPRPDRAFRTVGDYAQALGYSTSHAQHRLKRVWNHPPGTMLRAKRIELAARWLRETADAVDAIAHRAGYRSRTGFIEAFKRYYGTTPGRYRRDVR